MAGGIIGLVAIGAADLALTGNPQMTYFKVTYKRYSNFQVESIEQTFSGPADFGKRVVCTISRNADLIKAITLQVTLPEQRLPADDAEAEFRWLNYPGFRLIKKVELEIGGQTIDRQYGEWLYIWHQLSCPAGQRKVVEELVGHTDDLVLLKTGASTAELDGVCAQNELTASCVSRRGTPAKTLYVPLSTLFFAKNPGLAIPLIALQYHEVKINLEFTQFYECAYWSTSTGWLEANVNKNLVAASLYVDYVYLDTDERRSMSQKAHEYLIEQLQFTGGESITSSSYKSRLNFNHPTKELVWVVQRDEFVQCSQNGVDSGALFSAKGAQPFNFSDEWETDAAVISGWANTASQTDVSYGTSSAFDITDPSFGGLISGGTDEYLLAKCLLHCGVKCEGKNPVEVAKIQLNGHDRFSEREGRYFDKKVVSEVHTSSGATGINVYSFALQPEAWAPSGTLNFSRIDTATLHLTLSPNTVSGTRTATLRVYAVNYNILRVVSGMAGLAFAS